MVFVQNFKFSHSFFLVKRCQIIAFSAVLHREIGFQTIKTSIKESGKICIFPKGLVHGFSQKL